MYNLDFALLNTQIESIKNEEDAKKRNILILSAVEYLMDNVEYSAEALAEYEEFDVKKLFSSYRKAVDGACEFYETAKPVLDLEQEKIKVIQKLAETTTELSRVSQLVETNEKNEADLLSKREKLEKVQAEYDELMSVIAKLKETEKTVNDGVITEMHNTIMEKEQKIEETKEIISELEIKDKNYNEILAELENAYTKINIECRRIQTNIIDKIQAHYSEIAQVYDDNDMKLTQITGKIEKSLSDFETLMQKIENAQTLLKDYELHLGENSELVQAMLVSGIDSISEFNENTDSIKASAEQNLRQYDKMIKSVIVKAESAREEIKRLQNKR